MRAWINGIGWVTPAGFGQGRHAHVYPLKSGELEIPSRKQVFDEVDRRFGRLDDFSRVGLAALTFCLRDARAEAWQDKRPVGIVESSRYGCLSTDLAYIETMIPDHGKLASPNLFAYTLPNCFLGEAALRFGLTGNTMIFNRRDGSRLEPARIGLSELAWNDQCGVLAGITDLVAPPELALADDLPGSLFLLLEKEQRPGLDSYGEIECRQRQLLFKGEVVESLIDLVASCLGTGAGKHNRL